MISCFKAKNSCFVLIKLKTISDKVLKERPYEITTNPKYDWYQKELASIVYLSFHQKTGSGVNVKEAIAQVLHKKSRPGLKIIFEQ